MTQTTNDNKYRFPPDHEFAERWAIDTLSGKSDGGAFSTAERNICFAYLELLHKKKDAE